MIIYQEQLLDALGYDSVAAAEKCLKNHGIMVVKGKNGRIFTTLDAINAALLDKPHEKQVFSIDD